MLPDRCLFDAPQLGVHFPINIEIHTFDLAIVTIFCLELPMSMKDMTCNLN